MRDHKFRAGSIGAACLRRRLDGQEGKDIGGFHVTQSIEFGGRINNTTGSTAMYDTLVNYQSGARILEQSLTMQAKDQEEIFDTLTFSSFGWGGDPEQAARLGSRNIAGTTSQAPTSICRTISTTTC